MGLLQMRMVARSADVLVVQMSNVPNTVLMGSSAFWMPMVANTVSAKMVLSQTNIILGTLA